MREKLKNIASKLVKGLWRTLQKRFLTKDNLVWRGILVLECIEECGSEESVSHIFFECPIFIGSAVQRRVAAPGTF